MAVTKESPLGGRGGSWEDICRQWNVLPTPARRSPRHIEDRLQIECVRWFTLQHPDLAPLLHHSPNGGARSKAEGALFKAMGTRAGFPDLFLYHPAGPYHGLAIEMKTTERGSRQSDHQKHWQQSLTAHGYSYRLARTLDDFMQIVTEYLRPTPALP